MTRSGEADLSSLSSETLQRIVEVLEPFLTPERLVRIDAVLAARSRSVALVLEDLANDHNGAAVLRTADAFGFFEAHVIEPADGRFKISQRVSKGAHKWLDLHRHPSASEAYAAIRRRGYAVWASTLHGEAVDVCEVPIDRPVALVFGNELLGLSPQAIVDADGYFRIPMVGFVESFNISVAVALACYDLSRRRLAAGLVPGLDVEDRLRTRASWLVKTLKSAPSILARAGLPVPLSGAPSFALTGEGFDD